MATQQHTRKNLLKLSKQKLIKLCKKEKIFTTGTKNQMIDALLKKKPTYKSKKPDKSLNQKIIRICIYKKVKMRGAKQTERQKLMREVKFNKTILSSAAIGYKRFPIALCSNKLIHNDILLKLIDLIKPLQSKLYNYRDPKFIKTTQYYQYLSKLINNDLNDDDDDDDDEFDAFDYESADSNDEIQFIKKNKHLLDKYDNDLKNDNKNDYYNPNPKPKPKIKDLIAKFQHFYENKRMLSMMDKKQYKTVKRAMPVAPAIYDLMKECFLTEINGLLYSSNIGLYSVIGNVFKSFLPMFEWCTQTKFNKFKQLSVIIKMHEYIFENEYDVVGNWHTEGIKEDNICAVGLYYFNNSLKFDNNALKFDKNILELAAKHCHVPNEPQFLTQKINIKPNDCIVFANSYDIKHRITISAKSCYSSSNSAKYLSRKTLCFFLLDPNNDRVASYNSNDFKWINFPLKVNIIIDYLLKSKANKISNDIIILIKNFAFGDDKYQQTEMSNIRSDRRSNQFFTDYRRPFHVNIKRTKTRYHGVDD